MTYLQHSYHRTLLTSLFVACLAADNYAAGQALSGTIQRIDDSVTTVLSGNVNPLAAAASNSSPADFSTPMQHMVLSLKATDAQEAQLTQLIANQSNPKSPSYHQYLTPQTFAAQFGASKANIDIIKGWLQGHGLTVEEVTANNRAIVFSGTASQVASTFKTEIRQYKIAGVTHYANATDPKIPTALAGVVGGIVKLHDFKHANHVSKQVAVSSAQFANPQYTTAAGHYLAPADYATLYNISPLYSAGINGSGQTIAVLARANINLQDVQSFRNAFGLKPNVPQIVVANSDPGLVDGDSTETTLDTEWAGAVAPNVNVKVIVASSTNSADGIDLAATYAVNNNVAPILSLSYGSCELDMGSVELSYYNGLWKEAVAQGMTVIVASGDSGAAACAGSTSTYANTANVNGLCSSPYATCVGGTQFAEGTNPGQYWHPGNNPVYGSAISYIPETVWNESASNGGSGSYAGGGGQSVNFVKPAYQVTPGVTVSDRRDVPDVALTAAGHDGYLIMQNGSWSAVAGTSAATPSFAAMMALVNQKTGSAQGLANVVLYPLATLQTAGGAAVFHDITLGNNSVPGTAGFSASTGYDRASGLGSVDAAMMVNHWTDVSAGKLSLSASSSVLNVNVGQSGTTTLTSVVTGALTSPIAFSLSGLPKGVTGAFSQPTVAGNGSNMLTLSVLSTATPGTYPITVTATAGSVSATATISLIVPQPNFAISTTASYSTIKQGSTSSVTVLTTPTNGFSGTIALSVGGLPSGVTASFSPASLSGTTGGRSILTFSASASAPPGTYTVNIIGTSGGVTKSVALPVYVIIPAACTLNSNPLSVSLNPGASLGVQLTCKMVQGTFSGPLNLTVTGVPAGVTYKLSSGTLNPGQSVTMNLTSLVSTASSTSNIVVTAQVEGYSQSLTIPLTIVTKK